jgi:hypothetical protein
MMYWLCPFVRPEELNTMKGISSIGDSTPVLQGVLASPFSPSCPVRQGETSRLSTS